METVIELNPGEAQDVQLTNDKKVNVKLVDIKEICDNLRGAVRRAEVRVAIDGQETTVISGTYHLPVKVGQVQIDCPVTSGYLAAARGDNWGLGKAARLRLWPADSPWRAPRTFIFPVKQRLFATSTQMGNEPVFVDGGEDPAAKSVYYHFGQDLGGADGLDEVVSATNAVVVSLGEKVLPEYAQDTPVEARYDGVYTMDRYGVFYRYSHLAAIDSTLKLGEEIKAGRKLGILGKEADSGGWAHLHFQMISRQPSGKWGTQDGYVFLLQACREQRGLKLKAMARPHIFTWTGKNVVLDGGRSWGRRQITSYEWTFSDSTQAVGPRVERIYTQAGEYCEMLKVTDEEGATDYDFVIVLAVDPARPKDLPPTIHAAYHPSLGLKAGDPVTISLRSFLTTFGEEQIDFGDGSPLAAAKSDGCVEPLAKDGYVRVIHTYVQPGDYIVNVERTNEKGLTARQKMCVHVE